jgi:hypothetical protein
MEATQDTAAAVKPKKTETSLVEKVHAILVEKKAKIADVFLEMPYVKQALDQPERNQRILINRQLRMHLGQLEEDTSIPRMALDDGCHTADYLKNLRRYAAPVL